MDFDEKVLACFLEKQMQLFPEPVADTLEEAEYFLEDCCAVVVKGPKQVIQYFEETGADIEGEDEESILLASEVFAVGDGRYLIVDA